MEMHDDRIVFYNIFLIQKLKTGIIKMRRLTLVALILSAALITISCNPTTTDVIYIVTERVAYDTTMDTILMVTSKHDTVPVFDTTISSDTAIDTFLVVDSVTATTPSDTITREILKTTTIARTQRFTTYTDSTKREIKGYELSIIDTTSDKWDDSPHSDTTDSLLFDYIFYDVTIDSSKEYLPLDTTFDTSTVSDTTFRL